jgi:hypothetical protein
MSLFAGIAALGLISLAAGLIALLALAVAALLGAGLYIIYRKNSRLARELREERVFRQLFVDKDRVHDVIRHAAREFTTGCMENASEILMESPSDAIAYAKVIERETGRIVKGRRRFERVLAYAARLRYPVDPPEEYLRKADKEADSWMDARPGRNGPN